jgi:hypothetical protein
MPFEPVPVEQQVDPTAADTETLVEMGVVEPQPEPVYDAPAPESDPEPEPETPDAA